MESRSSSEAGRNARCAARNNAASARTGVKCKMPNAECGRAGPTFVSAFCICHFALHGLQQESLVQAPGAIPLQVDGDVAVADRLQLAHNRGADFRFERARELVATELDA